MAESGEEEVTWVDLTRNTAGQHVMREANRRHTQEGAEAARSWRVGLEGEHLVAEILTQLTDRSWRDRLRRRTPAWWALQSVEVSTGRSDIDHIVFGPPGVFTINTKHHPHGKVQIVGDTIQVNRHDTEYVPKAQAEAKRATRLLRAALQHAGAAELAQRLTVQPVIALVEAQLLNRGRPGGVLVTKAKDLPFYLRQLPECYSTADVQRIFELASRSTTWKTPGPVSRRVMTEQTWTDLVRSLRDVHTVLVNNGEIDIPGLIAYVDGEATGMVGLRPTIEGSDVARGIADMALLASCLHANEVVVVWEAAVLAKMYGYSPTDVPPSLNIVRASPSHHVLHQFPYAEQLLPECSGEGLLSVEPLWRTPPPAVPNGELEPSIAELLARSFRQVPNSDAPDLDKYATDVLKSRGYQVNLYQR